jgi:hypothetical protein
VRAGTEVAAPAAQQPGQRLTYVAPLSHVAWHQDVPGFLLQTLTLFGDGLAPMNGRPVWRTRCKPKL